MGSIEINKVKRLNKGNSKAAITYLRENINFSLNMGDGVYIQFIGGILSKLVNGELYFPRNGIWVKQQLNDTGVKNDSL